jgi:hypothetical protein
MATTTLRLLNDAMSKRFKPKLHFICAVKNASPPYDCIAAAQEQLDYSAFALTSRAGLWQCSAPS